MRGPGMGAGLRGPGVGAGMHSRGRNVRGGGASMHRKTGMHNGGGMLSGGGGGNARPPHPGMQGTGSPSISPQTADPMRAQALTSPHSPASCLQAPAAPGLLLGSSGTAPWEACRRTPGVPAGGREPLPPRKKEGTRRGPSVRSHEPPAALPATAPDHRGPAAVRKSCSGGC